MCIRDSFDTGQLPALQAGLRLPFEPFDLQLQQPRLWPGGIAVIEAQPAPELLRLHRALAAALRAQGVAVEARDYRPHLTLARRAQHAVPPPQAGAIRWAVPDGYALVCSVPAGPYQELQRYA